MKSCVSSVMANVSAVDIGVLLVIAVTASLANGSSLRKDVVQEAVGLIAPLPISVDSSTPPQEKAHSGSVGDHQAAGRRAKRCTCYSYIDKECVYYCHLDIIWINTPEHTVPNGISSYRGLARRRRSSQKAQRCSCRQQSDLDCSRFCMDSRQRTSQQHLTK